MTTALSVNSAGDWLAGTYGSKVDSATWREGGTAMAIARDISMGVLLQSAPQLVKFLNKALARQPKSRQALEQVSELTTNRLSVYLRCLTQLQEAGIRTISSQALAEQFHLN